MLIFTPCLKFVPPLYLSQSQARKINATIESYTKLV